jgi:hypothetical protein
MAKLLVGTWTAIGAALLIFSIFAPSEAPSHDAWACHLFGAIEKCTN